MVTYTFVRFLPNLHKETVGSYPQLLAKHDAYMKSFSTDEKIITEGFFSEHEGSILILNGEVNQERIENDPGVKGGAFLFEVKKIWVAKGSFCE